MLIVAGALEIDPAQRDAYLTSRVDRIRASRAEPGCLEYAYSADPIEPGRILLIERWASQEDLARHIAVAQARPASASDFLTPKSVSVFVYDVTGERPLGG